MKVITIVNQKGGTGKTTTSVNLSTYYANKGYRVLLIDADPQANASDTLLDNGFVLSNDELISLSNRIINDENCSTSSYDELEKYIFNDDHEEFDTSLILENPTRIKECVLNTDNDNLNVVRSSPRLSVIEKMLRNDNETSRTDNRFKRAIARVKDEYDFIIIDCLPNTNLITLNAINCADLVLIPAKCDKYSLQGVFTTINYIKKIIQREDEDDLEINYLVFFNMVDKNNKTSLSLIDLMQLVLPGHICTSFIRNSRANIVNNASLEKRIVIENPKTMLAQDFKVLSDEIITRL